MALDSVKNFAKVTVSTGYDDLATTVVLTAGHGVKLPTVPFNATWYNWTDYKDPSDDPNVEIIRVTNISTDTLTIVRAQEGTLASTKNTGGKQYNMIAGITAKTINDISSLLSGTQALSNNTATVFAVINLASDTMSSGELIGTVRAADASGGEQSTAIRFTYSAVNKAGTITVTISALELTPTLLSGTDDISIDATTTSTTFSLRITSNTSLTATTHSFDWVIISANQVVIAAPQALTTEGLDINRPAPSLGARYLATDSSIQYTSGVSSWYVDGRGSDKATFGPFGDSTYLIAPTGSATAGPALTNPYTLVISIYLNSLPGATRVMPASFSTGAFSSGWQLNISAGNNNKPALVLKNVNSDAAIEFASSPALTTGAHCLAFAYNGTNVRYCCDGGTVYTTATTGTFAAPGTGDAFNIGRWAGDTFAFSQGEIAFIQGWSSAFADADLQVVTSSPSSMIPVKPSAGTCVYNLQARWQVEGAFPVRPIGGSFLSSNGTIYKQTH